MSASRIPINETSLPATSNFFNNDLTSGYSSDFTMKREASGVSALSLTNDAVTGSTKALLVGPSPAGVWPTETTVNVSARGAQPVYQDLYVKSYGGGWSVSRLAWEPLFGGATTFCSVYLTPDGSVGHSAWFSGWNNGSSSQIAPPGSVQHGQYSRVVIKWGDGGTPMELAIYQGGDLNRNTSPTVYSNTMTPIWDQSTMGGDLYFGASPDSSYAVDDMIISTTNIVVRPPMSSLKNSIGLVS
jgi:hypothetical protein